MGRSVAYAPFDARRVLRAIRLVSPADRAVDHADNYRVRVGVAVESRIDWIGEWDGANCALKAHVPLVLGGRPALARKLPESSVLVVDMERRGLPPSIRGAAVLLRVGSDFQANSPRAVDRTAQESIEAAADHQGDLGAGVEPVRVDLVDDPLAFSDDSYSSGAQSITAGGAFEDGAVSVTVRVPPGGQAYVKADADADAGGSGGTSLVSMAIGDGTTDHNEESISAADGVPTHIGVTFGGLITKTTTFKVRTKCATSNATLARQTLSVKAVLL